MKKAATKTDDILISILKIDFVFENLSTQNAKLGDSLVSYRNFKEFIIQTAELEMKILTKCYEESPVARIANNIRAPIEKSVIEKDLDDFAEDEEIRIFRYGQALSYDEINKFDQIVDDLNIEIDQSEITEIVYKIKEYIDLIYKFKKLNYLFVDIKSSFRVFSDLIRLYNKHYFEISEESNPIKSIYELFFPNTIMSIFSWDLNRIKLEKLTKTYFELLDYSQAEANDKLPVEFINFLLESQEQIGQIFGYESQYYQKFKNLPFFKVFRGLDDVVKLQPFREACSILKKSIKEYGEQIMSPNKERTTKTEQKVEIGAIGSHSQVQIQTKGTSTQKYVHSVNIDKSMFSDLIHTLISSDYKPLEKIKVLEKADAALSGAETKNYESVIVEEINNLDESSRSKLKGIIDELINIGLAVEASIIGNIIFQALF